MSEITITCFNTADRSIRNLAAPEEIPVWLSANEGFYWLEIEDTNPEKFTHILEILGIDLKWQNFFDRPEILPHLTDSPNLLSFYLYDVVGSEALLDSLKEIIQIQSVPFAVLLGVRFVITYRQQPLNLIDYVRKDCIENFKLSGKTPGFIVFLLMQHSLFHFSRLNLANDNFLDQIASSLMSSGESKNLAKISTAGLNILTLKNLNINMSIVLLVMVTKYTRVVSEESRVFFSQMLDNTQYIRSAIDSSRNSLDSIIASINARHSRHTERVMRILTILSAIFLPLTLIAGIYGMNFTNMPELKWSEGYYYALGLMVGIAMLFLSAFYYFGWIGREE